MSVVCHGGLGRCRSCSPRGESDMLPRLGGSLARVHFLCPAANFDGDYFSVVALLSPQRAAAADEPLSLLAAFRSALLLI